MFPQVLLLGNGLNLTCYQNSWGDMIDALYCNPKIDPARIKNIPFPLQVILATGDKLDKQIENSRKLFYGLENVDPLRPMMEQILDLSFDHILTTNYSYEIERVGCPKVAADGNYCRRLVRNIKPQEKAEGKYLLHTYNELSYHGHTHKVWHIHGEARKPQSVVLGHYYYGQLLCRYQAELANRANQQAIRQRHGEPIIVKSWLDAFIMGDVYVLGFGYDFSEMDLWWLLNRKKREKAEHGSLYFYEPGKGNELKHSLLDVYGAKVETLGFYERPSNYEPFYMAAIADVTQKMKAAALREEKI